MGKRITITLILFMITAPVFSKSTVRQKLKIWDDGTAYVKGRVLEHPAKDTIAGKRFLKLFVEDKELFIIYTPGENAAPCLNDQSRHAQNIKTGDQIKAFGAYKDSGNYRTLSTCASKDYFIRTADEGTPLGPVTEQFFEDAAKLKSETARNQFQEAQKSKKWNIFRNDSLGYSFSYPATWSMPQMSMDSPFAIQYHDFSSPSDTWYTITTGFISGNQLATMGVDYCAVNQNDSERCEQLAAENTVIHIDWGQPSGNAAIVKIDRPQGGQITFNLEPISAEARTLFIPILKTFRFDE